MRVCVCVCVCLSVCLPLSLFSPNTVEFCYAYELLLHDFLVYCIHYHNIAVRCTKTGIKHVEEKKKNCPNNYLTFIYLPYYKKEIRDRMIFQNDLNCAYFLCVDMITVGGPFDIF